MPTVRRFRRCLPAGEPGCCRKTWAPTVCCAGSTGAWESEGERWLESALTGLSRVHAAAAAAGLQDRVARVGAGPDWLRAFIDTPRRIGRFLELPCPKLDDRRLTYVLNVSGNAFVKWNARPERPPRDPTGASPGSIGGSAVGATASTTSLG